MRLTSRLAAIPSASDRTRTPCPARRTRFPSACYSSLPYFVALACGFFYEQNIEPEMHQIDGRAWPNVAALITNQIEV